MKNDAHKIRKLYDGRVLVGFAGSSADAFALLERFEGKLRDHQGSDVKAATELANRERRGQRQHNFRRHRDERVADEAAGGEPTQRAQATELRLEVRRQRTMPSSDYTRREQWRLARSRQSGRATSSRAGSRVESPQKP